MKKIFALMLALVMVFSFAACGDDEANDTHGGSKADGVTCELSVNIEDEAHATCLCQFPDDSIQTCEVTFGGYGAYLNRDWETGEYTCTLYSGNEELGDADFTLDGSLVTFNLDMSDYDDFSFYDVSKFGTLTCRGEDEPATTTIYEASEVVK